MNNFIEEILSSLIEDALELSNNAVTDFEKGKLTGFHKAISTIMNRAEGFGAAEKLPDAIRMFNAEDLLIALSRSEAG